ncbi:hypothetical protein NL676_036707 [Syzygium grande]|nr:hypothetical protein NL676_036707 [Syzygium grande]
MVVGELCLGVFLQVFFDRLASCELLSLLRQQDRLGIEPKPGKWRKIMVPIRTILADTEETNSLLRCVGIECKMNTPFTEQNGNPRLWNVGCLNCRTVISGNVGSSSLSASMTQNLSSIPEGILDLNSLRESLSQLHDRDTPCELWALVSTSPAHHSSAIPRGRCLSPIPYSGGGGGPGGSGGGRKGGGSGGDGGDGSGSHNRIEALLALAEVSRTLDSIPKNLATAI